MGGQAASITLFIRANGDALFSQVGMDNQEGAASPTWTGWRIQQVGQVNSIPLNANLLHISGVVTSSNNAIFSLVEIVNSGSLINLKVISMPSKSYVSLTHNFYYPQLLVALKERGIKLVVGNWKEIKNDYDLVFAGLEG